MDLQNGEVVRGIAGRRREYRPIVSCLTPSTHPLVIAEAFRGHFGLTDLYVADLDAIAGSPPSMTVFNELRSRGFHLWVDAGVQDVRDVARLAESEIGGIVVGLETLQGPDALAQIIRCLGSDRVVFSLDMKEGTALGEIQSWESPDALAIAAQAVELRIQKLLVLDLARVGIGGGIGTEDMCRQLIENHPHLEIAAGGGMKDASDLRRLDRMGVQTVLIASALHDGRLRREDLEGLRNNHVSNR